MLTVGELRKWLRENPRVDDALPIYIYAPDWALLKKVSMDPLVRDLNPYDTEGFVFIGYDRPGNEGKV